MRTASGFDWDDGNRTKCEKHGVSIGEIEALFQGALRVAPDVKHSRIEQRFLATGRTAEGRPLFVAFTWRGRTIRPLSARYMHAEEAARYEASSGV